MRPAHSKRLPQPIEHYDYIRAIYMLNQQSHSMKLRSLFSGQRRRRARNAANAQSDSSDVSVLLYIRYRVWLSERRWPLSSLQPSMRHPDDWPSRAQSCPSAKPMSGNSMTPKLLNTM
jgi:hypothetical protein